MLTPGVEKISQISHGPNGYREGETELKTRGLPSIYVHSKQSNQEAKATDWGSPKQEPGQRKDLSIRFTALVKEAESREPAWRNENIMVIPTG